MSKAHTGIITMLLVVLLIALSAFERGGAGTYVEGAQSKAGAVMWLERHELTMRPGAVEALLDGASVAVEPLLVHQGRSYVAVKTIEQAGAGSVYWDAAKRQAIIQIKDTVHGSLDRLVYEAGTQHPYRGDGTALEELRMPPPFLYEGRMYIPVSVLPAQGIAVDWQDGALTWRWSDKRMELASDQVVVTGRDYVLTVMYQQELRTPQLMMAGGGGSWSALDGQVLERGIVQSDRKFNRIDFRMQLQPGPNPIEVRSAQAGSRTMEIYWEPGADTAAELPVRLYAEGEERVQIAAPVSGYTRLAAGEALEVSGRILHSDPSEGEVALAVWRFDREAMDYTERMQEARLPVKDGQFSGHIQLEDGGDYLIQIISPKYMEMSGQDEKGTVLWGELRAVVDGAK